MRGALEGRRRAAGQTLAIFALMLPLLVGMAGLGADGANAYLHYRNAQSAADLAALAGARLLPQIPSIVDYTNAQNRAVSVASLNGYPSGVTARAPYIDSGGTIHPHDVEVLIDSTVQTYFLPLFGQPSWDLSVRAVAGSSWSGSGGSFPAVFAGCENSTQCPDPNKAIDWSGSDGEILGGMHSNCGISVGGQFDVGIGGTAYRMGCTFSGGGNTFEPNPPGPQTAPTQAFPVNYTAATFACDYTREGLLEIKAGGEYTQPGLPTTIKPGVYCATGPDASIKIPDQYMTGTVTLVVNRGSEDCTVTSPTGKEVDISGSDFNLIALHSTKVLIYTNAVVKPAVKIAGSFGQWNGLIVAPCGHVEISGQSNETVGGGSILANTVNIAGSNVRIDSNGLSTLGPSSLEYLKLYE